LKRLLDVRRSGAEWLQALTLRWLVGWGCGAVARTGCAGKRAAACEGGGARASTAARGRCAGPSAL